ncbi:FeoB-associated Cys-rich membrane protein [Clostridium saccharobutylicum]|uniref:FeoB-associated Cys-rich membrane protein n=1 Tax=Clostridium saccharobutylicum TaxID=169679 RepID=UPI00041C22F0|nr:FeoB-associated Cys-rich membrane protein [Clostridium saccharobutylicum]MBA2905979.1 hypothetical protein [Clostridium saccharobutylicum]MBA8790531.1 hypothetical protein [Clostridium saccharobutylicum]MBA8897215.1 hypothetical protein [Clostridium saccharobutylicum]MBA8982922.1 hypothetical protein [Clostridium saccharobutylicum]MBA8994759.1 hypothetical protein [Clostridium saccharobutylicum]
MIEIIITVIICLIAFYIIVKSVRNSSKGKCSCGCKGCKLENKCESKDKKQN